MCVYTLLPLTLALKFSLFVSFSPVLCDNAQCGTHMVLITTLSDRTVLGRACYRHVSPVIILGRSLRIDLLLITTVENQMAKITNFISEIVFPFLFSFLSFSSLFFAPTEFPYYDIYSKISLCKVQTLIVSVRRNSL